MSTTHQIPDLGAATLSDSTVENTLELQIVHALRVQGFVEAGTVVEATGLAVDEVVAVLHGLADLGFVRHREGRISGWALTSEGRASKSRVGWTVAETADLLLANGFAML